MASCAEAVSSASIFLGVPPAAAGASKAGAMLFSTPASRWMPRCFIIAPIIMKAACQVGMRSSAARFSPERASSRASALRLLGGTRSRIGGRLGSGGGNSRATACGSLSIIVSITSVSAAAIAWLIRASCHW